MNDLTFDRLNPPTEMLRGVSCMAETKLEGAQEIDYILLLLNF